MKIIFLFLILLSSVFSATNLENITLYLKWKNQFQSAGFYIAKEKGFYKESGFQVSINEPKENQQTIKLVLENNNTYGVSDSVLVYEKMLGKKVAPLGAIFQNSLLVFFDGFL